MTGQQKYLRGAVRRPDGNRPARLTRTGTLAGRHQVGQAPAAGPLATGADTVLGEVQK